MSALCSLHRREFCAGLAAALASWPAVGQPSGGLRRVAVLMSGAEDDPQQKERWEAFRQSFESLGWTNGRNILLDVRFAGRPDRFETVAREAIALSPDVIFVQSTGFVTAVARQTRDIPTVFTNVSDPIGAGLVATFAKPGGNMTGLVLLEATIAGKWLSMLKEISQGLRRAALMGNPKTSAYEYFLRSAREAAPAARLEIIAARVGDEASIVKGFDSFAQSADVGLAVVPDLTMTRHRRLLIDLAARHRIPAIYPERFYTAEGGLMSYGVADLVDQFRQAAFYVDRILKGERPADLPVQGPTKYSTILNLKTARALGLAVSPGLLVAADEVIE
jgi:putative ABC transport system substrate-binding protein